MGSESDTLGLIGSIIADKYAVESVVGEGGFAVVYRATHMLWKRPVAVKVFKALGEVAPHERQKLLADFIQEGALLADLSERSTAICQARDVGMLTTPTNEEVPYMVLEWLEGQPLESVLLGEREYNAPLRSLEQAIYLLDPAAEALALAHKKGIAHRDVKPANVFVLGDPRGSDVSVKLLDFGIAKVVQDAQKMGFGKTAGHITSFTPTYGAPEQFNRAYGATGPWTDVFALALVVVETITGHEPLVGDTLVQLAYAASDPGVRPTPRQFGAQMSDEVDAVFRKALAVKPEERYQTAGEFWNALRTTALGQEMSAIASVRSGAVATVLGADTVVNSMDLGATALAPAMQSGSVGVVSPGSITHMANASPASPKSSGAGLAIVGMVGALVVAGAVGFFVFKGRSGPTGGDPSARTSATPPSASASAVAPIARVCPAGMKLIPGGEFFMGSDEKDAEPNEKPPHKVKLAAYCLDELEVSVAKYKACSDRGACLRAAKENEWDGITALQHKIYDPLCNITDPVGRAQHPINCVNWEQARKYCEAQDGRLPTEAEWEFAARGSDGRIYPWGDDKPSAQLLNACGKECVAWMKKNPDPDQPIAAMFSEDDGFPTTAPVGSFPKGKSSWGIQDIVGNVWEWVADWYAPYEPSSASTVTPNPSGPAAGSERIIRGGAWNGAQPSWVRPAWRFHAIPTNRTHGTGFRCAKSLE
jgi:formylglycine-generating enzyme required for sulfatase activity/serine/threonine protein kinase